MYTKTTRNLGIIGCGWLGKATAKIFLKNNWAVKGTVRSETSMSELSKHNIVPFQYELGASLNILNSFFNSLQLLIIAIPPGLKQNNATHYLNNLKTLSFQIQENLPETVRIIFVSSTGVYPNSGGPYSENTIWQAASEKARYLWEAEQLFSSLPHQTCVLRLAGLVGGNREPVISLSKKESLEGGNLAANLIHQQDAARLIHHLGNLNELPTYLNGVFPQKIKKGDFYKMKALQLQLPIPKFRDTEKTIDRHIFSEIEIAFTYKNSL